MATKLKGLEVGKVDFVDEGANQRADIKLLKGKNKVEETSDPEIGLFKRFLNWISGEVQKSATTFDEQINAVSMDAIRDEIWSVCYALQNSLNSILCDPELDSSGKQSAMDTSIEQFATAMKEYIPGWAGGTSAKIKKNLDAPDETDLPMVMKAHSNLEEIIQKSVETKGELEDMIKIDKSKMSAEERAAYDELIKKFAVETNEEPSIEKKAPQKSEKEENPDVLDDGGAEKKTDTKKSLTPPEQNTDDDIYKGLHPLVREKLEALEKRAEEAEDRELYAVAKKYEVLGEKPEELAKSLKTLKSAGGTAYNDMIGILDRNVAMINNSGVFGEIGKSFSGGTAAVKKSAAEGKIDTIAKGLIEKDPSDGLCGKTDEDNFGSTYEVLDQYIRTGKIDSEEIKSVIDSMHEKNLFKLQPMPHFEFYGPNVAEKTVVEEWQII